MFCTVKVFQLFEKYFLHIWFKNKLIVSNDSACEAFSEAFQKFDNLERCQSPQWDFTICLVKAFLSWSNRFNHSFLHHAGLVHQVTILLLSKFGLMDLNWESELWRGVQAITADEGLHSKIQCNNVGRYLLPWKVVIPLGKVQWKSKLSKEIQT